MCIVSCHWLLSNCISYCTENARNQYKYSTLWQNSTNPAIWLVPGAGGIFSSGPLTVGRTLALVACAFVMTLNFLFFFHSTTSCPFSLLRAAPIDIPVILLLPHQPAGDHGRTGKDVHTVKTWVEQNHYHMFWLVSDSCRLQTNPKSQLLN